MVKIHLLMNIAHALLVRSPGFRYTVIQLYCSGLVLFLFAYSHGLALYDGSISSETFFR